MADFKQKAVGAMVGAVVADAAGMPVHWVYDADQLNNEILKGREDPEFLAENHCPFYTLPCGKNSFYGDQILATLEAVVQAKGWKKDVFEKKLVETFGEGTAYDYAKNGVDIDNQPIKAPWLSHVLSTFLETQKGEGTLYDGSPMNDSEVQAVPLAAFYAGKPELKDHLEEMSRTTQNNDLAAEIGLTSGLLEEQLLLTNDSLEDIVKKMQPTLTGDAASWVNEVLAAKEKGTGVIEVATEFGRACGVPGNFKTGLYVALVAGDDYKKAVRDSIRAAGDTCGRSAFVGALLGARLGIDALPKDWINKTEAGSKVLALAEELVTLRQ